MRNFRDLTESKGTVVFTFGRFNPPTTGHEKLIKKVASVAGSNTYRIYPSHSQNPKKDPLPYALKIAYLRKMFPRYAKNIMADKTAKTAIDIAVKLYDEGYTTLVMIAGSDRVKEFSSLLKKYNGVENKRHGYYKFDVIDIVSAGERDPDAEGVEGMSASKMRAAASAGDFDSFKTGLPSSFRDAQKLYNDVRKYMGIREERDMGEMNDFETLRDMYLTGKLWNIGDIVEANGVEGRVIRKGTNYVAFNDSSGKVHKAWLHDIVERNYAKEYENYHSSPEQIARRSSRNKAQRMMGTIDGMDVHHKDNNPLNNDPDNLEHMDRSENRREPRLRERRVKQDPDIKDSPGTEPAKYYAKDAKGKEMAKSTKQARDRHFTKGTKMDDDNPAAYKPAPGDKGAKTKPSKHTKKFKQMYGEVKIKEKLGKDADAGDYIDDFKKSDAPQFKGKSDKKKRDMAIAAYLDAKDKKEEVELDEVTMSKALDIDPKDVNRMKTLAILYTRAMKLPAGSPKQDKFKKEIEKLRKELGMSESVFEELVKSVELDEVTGINIPELIKTTIFRLTHPKGYRDIIQKYAERVKQTAGFSRRPSNGAILSDLARQYGFDRVKPLQVYINKLVDKGKLPQALAAEFDKDADMDESLWANIHKKRQRIKQGSGERMRKKGEKGAPTSAQMKRAKGESVDESKGFFTRSKSPESKGKSLLRVMKSDLEKKLKDIPHSLSPDKTGNRIIIKVKSSDVDKTKKLVGLPNVTQVVSEDAPNTRDAMKRFKAGDAGFSDKAHLKAKGLIPRADGTKKKSPQYEETQDVYHLDEKIAAIVKKAEKSGMPYGILKKVYDRGMAAWRTGHRPGTTPQQWGLARVNSFVTKSSGTWGKADKDLAAKVRGESVEILKNSWGEVTEAAEYQGRKVQLNNPTRGDVKKYKVYVRNDKGNVVKVEFGDPNMSIKRDDPERRKSFRARHGCDTNPGPKYKAKYWSCKFWSTKSVTDLMKG